MGALAELVEREAIRAVGLSNFSCEQLRGALEFGPVHAVQVPFSILQPRAASELIPFCLEHGIAVLAYSPLSKGLLTGKFGPDEVFEGVRAKDPEYVGNRYHRNLRIVESLRAIAAEYGRTPAQLAINWVANYPGVTSALMGAKRPSQVADNAGAAGWTISPEHQARIQELTGAIGREP
jgi:aryl-alcohol dehydrogenase-like predicted oxidoreductase